MLTFFSVDIPEYELPANPLRLIGRDNVKSEVMLALWDVFKREGIRVPYPVREIRIRGGALPVESVVEVSS